VSIAVVGVVLFAVPLASLLFRTPWDRFVSILGSEVVISAARVSLISSLAATILSAGIGIPLATVLARANFRGMAVLRGIVTLPMVLPPVVGGATLLFTFGRRGVIGGPLFESAGLLLPFSLWGVIAANTFVALPFLVITVESGLRALDERVESAASGLGAKPWTVFRLVTLPLLRPSIVAGMVIAWARALGEFGATITFAGNLAGRTQTLPLAVFVSLESDRDAAIAISLVLVLVSLAVLIGLRDRWWRGT
jgi:molybdate transport system permease protein